MEVERDLVGGEKQRERERERERARERDMKGQIFTA